MFEAPRSEDFNLRVIEAIVKQIPNKPIRFVVNSHQHFDAAAGLRAYSHIGATIVTLVAQLRVLQPRRHQLRARAR